MRLGPTLNPRLELKKQQRLSCSKCKADFIVLQLIKINEQQLCIWCAGHPVIELSRSFTVGSKTKTGR
jgi:hypothetical protein